MIPRTRTIRQAPAWQHALARAVTDPAELLSLLELHSSWLPAARRAARDFPLRVPRGFVARMRKGDPDDPLLRQVLPLAAEFRISPGYTRDPVGDQSAMAVPGLLHKYHGRVLLTVTGACAIHCRYCFRRHYPYADANPAADQWQRALEYIAADREITEVILSGGDPLTLSDSRLTDIVSRLEGIAHLRRLRLHTRLPIVLPERVTPPLLDLLAGSRFDTAVVVHANHPNEIDAVVRAAMRELKDVTVLLNQSVLLKGVNDSADALIALSERLFESGALPYYLHMLDRVTGAAHFEVGEDTAVRLHAAMQAMLPGYLVPRLVREQPGASGKTLVV